MAPYRGNSSPPSKRVDSLILIPDDEQIYISSVTLYELLMGASTPDKITDIKILTDEIPVLPFNEEIAEKSAEIYHQLRQLNKMIEFRDIFIAATCLVNNLPVKTLNKKHFDRIQELSVQ